VGFKPTYGRVSRYGLVAFASSLDQIGPITLTVRDAALVLSVIAGPDPRDATAAMEPVPDFTTSLGSDIRGARIGVPRAVIEEGLEADVMRAYDEALAVLGRQGARLVDIDLPHAPYAIPVYYLVAPAEASSNLARYDGVRYGFRASLDERPANVAAMYDRTRDLGFGPEVKRRIMLGTYALSAGYYEAYYRKAQQVRMLIRQDYDRAFERVDAVAMPTSPCAAFKLGERADDPLQMYLTDVFTVSANLTGLPALNVPCGFTAGRLPTGFQFIGRPFDEATLLKLADAYEREAPWWQQAPQD
jgi:aspartyl-tRNA(Asn)/glutamyl-tRNA(Gln) amidotransferase subunit A